MSPNPLSRNVVRVRLVDAGCSASIGWLNSSASDWPETNFRGDDGSRRSRTWELLLVNLQSSLNRSGLCELTPGSCMGDFTALPIH